MTLNVAHVVFGLGLMDAVGRMDNQTLPFAVGSATAFSIVAMSGARCGSSDSLAGHSYP